MSLARRHSATSLPRYRSLSARRLLLGAARCGLLPGTFMRHSLLGGICASGVVSLAAPALAAPPRTTVPEIAPTARPSRA
ncbi:MAG TPA: hypothetical protein EYH41_10275, partial [Novosphingobium capsulatum]|nr:hypothetical protein [Novosphingobium capsulatum]